MLRIKTKILFALPMCTLLFAQATAQQSNWTQSRFQSSKHSQQPNTGYEASAVNNSAVSKSPVNTSPIATTTASRYQKTKTHVTRQTRFGIPFQVSENPQNLTEVQLFVSNDRGSSWNLYQRQFPGTREFPFAAKADGEYHFAIKTIDKQKNPKPKGDPTTELIVVVDTKNPALSFNVHTDPSGKLIAWWKAVDPNLDSQTIQILYRPHSPFRVNMARWKQAKFDPPQAQSGNSYEAKAVWWPVTDSLTLDIQARIADKAGNISTVDRRVLLSRIVKNPPTTNSQKPPAIDPFAVVQQNTGLQRAANDAYSQKAPTNATGWQSGPAKTQVAQNSAAAKSNFSKVSTNSEDEFRHKFVKKPDRIGTPNSESTDGGFFRQDWDSGKIADDSNFKSQEKLSESITRSTSRTNPRNSMLISSNKSSNETTSNSNRTNAHFANHSNGSHSSGNRPDRNTSAGNGSVETLGQFANQQAMQHSRNKRLSRFKRFNIDYEIDSIDPTTVSKVSLWMTKDGGQTWYVATNDEDLKSPVVVEVPSDGVYGIQIGVSSQDGLAARAPRTAEDADMWIEVDTTNPQIDITSTPYGKASDAGKLIINWNVSDRKLKKDPISLFYAAHPDGPWKEIATSLENQGVYRWKVSPNIPRHVYLRAEAIDVVGNKGIYILDKSIDLAGLVPRGRIRAVTPLEE